MVEILLIDGYTFSADFAVNLIWRTVITTVVFATYGSYRSIRLLKAFVLSMITILLANSVITTKWQTFGAITLDFAGYSRGSITTFALRQFWSQPFWIKFESMARCRVDLKVRNPKELDKY